MKTMKTINSKTLLLKLKKELNLKTIPNKKAKEKLAKGPANAIKAASLKGLFKLNGLYGTGLAQPKANLNPDIKKENIGTKKEPTGSK